jgi:nanoRNase/pAp phosphatase (c-di-AMP/oligoRNAs hydrolase)
VDATPGVDVMTQHIGVDKPLLDAVRQLAVQKRSLSRPRGIGAGRMDRSEGMAGPEEDGHRRRRLDSLLEAVIGAKRVLILPHNDPDPDAIASAVALRYLLVERLGLESRVAYRGIIGRAENRAMVRYLGHPLDRLKGSDLRQSLPLALVDTQPGAGNNALLPGAPVAVVIDHHTLREATSEAAFADVRPELGATSTLLVQYLQAAALEPPPPLATALFYGIKTDTMSLARAASPEDVSAYSYLQPRVEAEALVEIEQAQVPTEYFQSLDTALHAARVYDSIVIAFLGAMVRPDMAAEMADLLLRLRGAQWTICMGAYEENLILAVRSRGKRGGAEKLAQAIVAGCGSAGGHGKMAGGQIPLLGEDPKRVADQLGRRALEHLHYDASAAGKPLL